MRWFLIALTFLNGMAVGRLLVYAFDDPAAYERQGLVRCDAPSGWCDHHEREEDPCGGRK